MIKIGLISDTHSYLDQQVFSVFEDRDETWHAGDIGNVAVARALAAFKPLKAVHGNIDQPEIRREFPEDLVFECGGLKVWITHIGGFPPLFNKKTREKLADIQPRLFVCGHSHILRVLPDRERGMLCLNPGAAGNEGFHRVRTLLTFEVFEGLVQNLRVTELGARGKSS